MSTPDLNLLVTLDALLAEGSMAGAAGRLRDGRVDLETGAIGKHTAPELRVQALFRDRLVGVVAAGHAL
jgi:DNA-binding transcriptional LysR family regulator